MSDYNEAKETRETEVSSSMRKLREITEEINSEVDKMDDRLTPIIRGAGLKGAEVDKPATPEYGTKLAQDINQEVRSLVRAVEKLQGLRNRIEL